MGSRIINLALVPKQTEEKWLKNMLEIQQKQYNLCQSIIFLKTLGPVKQTLFHCFQRLNAELTGAARR